MESNCDRSVPDTQYTTTVADTNFKPHHIDRDMKIQKIIEFTKETVNSMSTEFADSDAL